LSAVPPPENEGETLSWLIQRNSPPSAAAVYPHHDEHFREFEDGLAQVGVLPPPAKFLFDVAAGHGAAGDAAVAAGLLAEGGVRYALDHHGGFSTSALKRGAAFLGWQHLSSLPVPPGSDVTILVSHLVQQFERGDERGQQALEEDLKILVAFAKRVLDNGGDVWFLGLECADKFRNAFYIPSLIQQEGFAVRSHSCNPENRTPERGFTRRPKSFVCSQFPTPQKLVRLEDEKILSEQVIELDLGFGSIVQPAIDLPIFFKRVAQESVFAQYEYFLQTSDLEPLFKALESRRFEIADANLHNLELIGWSEWD
jgi:hypothetical protein